MTTNGYLRRTSGKASKVRFSGFKQRFKGSPDAGRERKNSRNFPHTLHPKPHTLA
ncbi:MAG: hypothetical protein F6J93_36955 [Oscillatoria sp. SIO1A7]|nr:hypothetical protein [Oscillatoria sp. SIO1A7]